VRGALIVSAFALALSACTGGNTTPPTPTTTSGTPTGTITLAHFYSDREAGVIQQAVDNFTAAYPGIKVSVQSGQDDRQMREAIADGQAIDVAITEAGDQLGVLCSSGSFVNLAPFTRKDGTDLGLLLPNAAAYTEFQGKRCALPMMGNATGLYYNTDMFHDAGITSPPKTLDQLAADAVKLTTYNDDGSIATLGFMPFMEYYETTVPGMAVTVQAKWFDDAGKSTVGTDPGWKTLLNWQKNLINKLGGYKKINAWMADSGDEFSEQNDFYFGRVAMMIDPQSRMTYIASEAPDMNYAVAPLPMSTDHVAAYGAGLVGGSLIGIPKGSKNPEAAWLLVKFLAMDTDTQVLIGNGLKIVPTLTSAVNSPALKKDANYQVFLDAALNPGSMASPTTVIGVDYQDLMAQFVQDWESGEAKDLQAGLTDVAAQIDEALT